MVNLFNYIERDSPIHRLTGASKLVGLLMWSLAAMTAFHTPLLVILTFAAFLLFRISRIKLKEISFMLKFTFVFMILNNLLIFLFSPQHAVSIYGTKTVLFEIAGPYVVTAEQLFYHLNVALKYTCTIPVVLLFVSTTNPSEFAASLNRIGVSYRISYAVSIALRYIPDIQREYYDISQSQQARGIEMSKKAKFFQRLKNISAILVPLILSSLERIDTISNAMELRGFGKGKKRTWYNARPFSVGDIIAMVVSIGLFVLSVILTLVTGSRFYNPFV
ncbi:MAG: energy-coupling factor transporter transmembrane component T [Candidatus Treponema excrementipullorum]|uniref:Energy-coupling factor transporter transmembrane protein EcfT n=1 Tax=Candidatus Treponema excrementipullorum TaxID=2838768 RepID=A0A9E2NYR7_9SPIR|nr:energy-coupling factor transporter transmembrane protein EcfT [Candidatus Treponema excrementipullorum]MCI6478938.1 energy-coupling factor transporter transmembrane protein EcfT [Spirochaetia bacterium]MCI7588556.1 energy-coupling factor transporter transmembrane protein EcfT [Spirochaetia bacterium]MDY4464933.1 energy-coupling factor transporter transmembrane component T [Candidatus Treponema excrementipullorum]